MAPEWRVLEVEFGDARMNLALEEAILEAMGKDHSLPNTVRLWRNPRAVVVGRFQDAALEVDIGACEKLGISIVRRCSGGGAVYHDQRNLNWSLYLKLAELGLKGEALTSVFRLAGSALIQGLGLLGLKAEFEPPSSVCIAGRKVSGMAMCVRGGNLLCHGTLLVSTDLSAMKGLLVTGEGSMLAQSRYVRSKRAEVTTVKEALKAPVILRQAKKALVNGIEETFEIRLKAGRTTHLEKELLIELYRKRYSKDEWNLLPLSSLG